MRIVVRPLEPFPDPRTLLDYLRGPDGTVEGKNRVLEALLRLRRDDGDVADVLLTLALWPALDRIYRGLRVGFPGDPIDVAGELAGAFAQACRKADPAKVGRVAATLTKNAQRDATRSLVKRKTFASQLGPEIERLAAAGDGAGVDDLGATDDDDGAWLRRRLAEEFGADGELVYDVAVLDLTQREAAARYGLPYDVTRKRHQRTTKRIRDRRPEYLRPRVPSRPAGWHLTGEGAGEAGVTADDDHEGIRGRARTASGAVSSVGTARDPADRRRIPDRARRGDHRRRDPRRGLPPRR